MRRRSLSGRSTSSARCLNEGTGTEEGRIAGLEE